MIGDREAIAGLRLEQVLLGHTELGELHAAVIRFLEGVKVIAHELEMLVFLRQLGNQDARLAAVDECHQADNSTWDDIGDEKLFAGHFIMVADQRGRGA